MYTFIIYFRGAFTFAKVTQIYQKKKLIFYLIYQLMHKKIRKNLEQLAKDILEGVSTTTDLKHKALSIYEQLTLLKFVEKEIKSNVLNIEEETVEKKNTEEINLEEKALEEELQTAIEQQDVADLFVRVSEKEEKTQVKKELFSVKHSIEVRDKIEFITHLFNGSQEDFNRVFSQLSSFASEKEAKNFVQNIVKPDYDWSGKAFYEEKLLSFIAKKFGN